MDDVPGGAVGSDGGQAVSAPREEDVEAEKKIPVPSEPGLDVDDLAISVEIARRDAKDTGERMSLEELVTAVELGGEDAAGLLLDFGAVWQRLRDAEAEVARLSGERERLREALEAADDILADVYAKGDKHSDRLLAVRVKVRAALSAGAEQETPDA